MLWASAFDRLLKRRGGVFVTAPAQTKTEFEQRIGVVGRHVGRGAVRGDCVDPAIERFQKHTALQVQCDGRSGVRRSRKPNQRRLQLTSLLQCCGEVAPALGVIGELSKQPRQQRLRLRIAAFEQRYAGAKRGIGPLGRKRHGAAKESGGGGEVRRRACRPAGYDERRNMIGAPRQACARRARGLVNLAPLQRDDRGKLMNGRIVGRVD